MGGDWPWVESGMGMASHGKSMRAGLLVGGANSGWAWLVVGGRDFRWG